ncbi:hypothetical protein [Muricoccus radiodurans]|uniref:hypothetical protein n=1 Tax=Muricoccus radiodurans TaxID=2231721 RepID=UPI003CE83C5B
MKITISQARPFPALPSSVRDLISNPGIAAVLQARAVSKGDEAAKPDGSMTAALSRGTTHFAGPLAPALSPSGASPEGLKLDAAFFAAIGLEPKSAKLFPKIDELVPPESKVTVRAALGELEKAAQEAVGKSAFEAGVFVLGTPEQMAKVMDGSLTITARLAAGGKLAAGGVKAIEPFVPALARDAPLLRDSLMLLTAPDALDKVLDPDQPAFRRLTAAGKLLATGAALAAHFVPALSAHAAQISTVGWLCDIGDKTYAAFVEVPKPAKVQ